MEMPFVEEWAEATAVLSPAFKRLQKSYQKKMLELKTLFANLDFESPQVKKVFSEWIEEQDDFL